MPQNSYEVIRLTGSRECQEHGIERLRRGFAFTFPTDPQLLSPWEAQNLIDKARITAINEALKGPHVFALESVLVLDDLPMWRRNPDVHVRVPSRYTTTVLDAVNLGPHRIAQASVRQCRVSASPSVVVSPGGIPHDDLAHTALLLAAGRPLIEGFVAVSGVLRRLCAFDRFDLEASRTREDKVRSKLFTTLESIASLRGRRRAELVLAHADAGCESVGESASLAVVSTIDAGQIQTQHEVVIDGRRYFLDLAFPEMKIGFEFDGVKKMGTTREEFRRAQVELMARQRALENAGWLIIRIGWEDLLDPARLREGILGCLTSSGRWKDPHDPSSQRLRALMLRDLRKTR